jgi:hypothetical protein
LIDKNLLFTVGSIRNVILCVKNILPQDVVCETNDSVVDRVIRYNIKSIHLSVFSSKKQMLFTELRQASSTRFFYDALCLDVSSRHIPGRRVDVEDAHGTLTSPPLRGQTPIF